MRLLALDTTTRRGSVALVDDDRIVAEYAGEPTRTHAERLPGELLDLLSAAGAALASIDVFAVAAGPGSFTGLRIGIAAVQGLAVVTNKPVVAVSMLEALAVVAAQGRPSGAVVASWIDAHRHDVFAALYRIDATATGTARLVEIDPPRVGRPDAILAEWRSRTVCPEAIAGDGAALYADLLTGAIAALAPPPMAGVVGRVAAGMAALGGAVTPAAVHPLYVRRPDAELARELKA